MKKLLKNVKKSEKMRSCGTPCKCLDFGPFSGVGKSGQKSRFFLWIFDEKRTIGLRNFKKKIFIFARRFWALSRGCTSRFLECTKMIGIIWESVLRVPIYIILSEAGGGGVLGGPKEGQKKALSFWGHFCQFLMIFWVFLWFFVNFVINRKWL